MPLSKSDFLQFLDAPLHLWAAKHNALEKTEPSTFEKHVMKEGQEVEKLANIFLEQFELPKHNKKDNKGKTSCTIAFQTTFTDGEFESRTDAIISDPSTQTIQLYEIKSSTFVKKEQLKDIAFQWVVCNATQRVTKAYLVHLNKEYVRQGEIDLSQLFVVEDVTEKCKELEPVIRKKRKRALAVVQAESQENIDGCMNPNTCPCKQLCHPNLPAQSIFYLRNRTHQLIEELRERGIRTIDQIPPDVQLSYVQRVQRQSIQQNKAIFDAKAIHDELSQLSFPLYFLDYETYNSAVPLYDGYCPQQQMVFQFSLHSVFENGEMRHDEYIATQKGDPSLPLLEKLQSCIGNTGSVIVWNKPFEASRNDEMAQRYPQFASFLQDINERMYDLAEIFKLGLYMDPAFYGHWSIKNVLPVLVPSLSYANLEIGKGDQAMIAWWEMVEGEEENGNVDMVNEKNENGDESGGEDIDGRAKIKENHLAAEFGTKDMKIDSQQLKTKENLLKYCALDTLAMVEVWRKVKERLNSQ